MNTKKISIISVFLLLLLSSSIIPKQELNRDYKQFANCKPDIYMYQGYDGITLATASINQDLKLAEKHIIGLGGVENYKKWRATEDGCGVMYYFFKAIIDDGISDYLRVEFSDIYKNTINNLTAEYLYKEKDNFIQSKMRKGEYPVDVEISVVDGDYTVASTVRQNLINYLNFKKGQ